MHIDPYTNAYTGDTVKPSEGESTTTVSPVAFPVQFHMICRAVVARFRPLLR
jgi:hypothetical protein